MVRKRFHFIGRVQGVGFRATARFVAAHFRLSGWVQNESDGSVSLEAQGESEEIEAFISSLRATVGRGIQSESTIPLPLEPGEDFFEVRR